MSINQCLDTAVKGGELSNEEADSLKRDYERFRENRENGGPALAAEQAKADLLESIAAATAHKRRKAKLALANVREIDRDLRAYRDAKGRANIATAALDKLEHFGSAPFSSVAGRSRAIVAMAHAKMEETLHHFRRGALLGDKARWNAADLRNLTRELFGEDTGDQAAKGMAAAWKETAEWLRQRFNSAGGAIGKLENWGLPQHHDPRALQNMGRESWKEFIRPRLDLERMRHPLTGKKIYKAELDWILDEIWETIVTDGWATRQPSRAPSGRGALANQRAEHRFLVFRDADTWLQYQEAFGGGSDPFATMMGHINMMAKDIGAMEILGPNPSGTIELMKQMIEKEKGQALAGKSHRLGGATAKTATDRAASAQRRLDTVWGSIRGELSTPVNTRWANALGAARSIITSAILGQAAISAISDVGTQAIARSFAGISSKGVVPEMVKAFGTGTRREAVQAGLILDSAANVFHAQARYVGTLSGPEWANYLADRVLTWSGLTPWTQASRHAFGLAFETEAANRVGLSFDELPDAFRNTFRRYGIQPHDWDVIRRSKLHGSGDGKILRPAEIAELDPRLAERYIEMVHAETEFAVPNGSHRSRTALLDQNQPGTFWGEVARSFAQFKSFGAVIVLLHGMRTHQMIAGGQKARGALYAGSLILSTSLLGAVAIQLKQIASGRDPRDMTTLAFAGAALLQGGGLGIYGDFLFSDLNRYGGGFSTTLGGPVIQRANDLWNLTAGNAVQFLSGEKTQFGRELVRFAKGNTPGGNIWYLKLAWERVVMDQFQFLVDPEANKAFKRQQQFWAREFDQGYFWAPGTLTPQRAPDIGAFAGR